MKKIFMLTALAVLLAVPAMAAIKNTRHNLGNTGDYTYRTTSETTQVCIFCHTPHNPTQNVPIWNRNNPAGGFKMYTGSPTITVAAKGDLAADSISRFCLSCHDGVTSLINVRNKASETMTTDKYVNRGAGSRTNIGGGALADLTNDHPVNINYDIVQAADPYFRLPADALANGVRFFKSSKGAGANFVECASCHDPHGAGHKRFLRKSNDSSSLCLTCHTK
ncbi:MAG: cytochrome c3 family protein [Deltaproteobacteria bacterium]|nr:cytochrome c3 family protein [Deltaproteobacteria bacterium]